jgi:hypothetical protein
MMHKKANPTLLKFYEYKQGLKSLSPEGEGFNQLGDYKISSEKTPTPENKFTILTIY